MKKKRVKNWVKVLVYSFLLFFTSVFIIVSASLLYRSLNPEAHKDNLLVSYNSEDNLSYRIKTKENSFYSDSDMNMNKQYVSAVIDKIIFDVSYEYNASKLLDYEYDYSIVATLVGDYKSQAMNSELWTHAVERRFRRRFYCRYALAADQQKSQFYQCRGRSDRSQRHLRLLPKGDRTEKRERRAAVRRFHRAVRQGPPVQLRPGIRGQKAGGGVQL